MNSVVAELVKITGKERLLLEQCKDFLSTLAAMQVSLVSTSSKTTFRPLFSKIENNFLSQIIGTGQGL